MNFLHQFVSVISMNASNLLFVKWNIELCLSQLFINLFNGKPAVSDEIRASMCIFVWCRSSGGLQKNGVTYICNKFDDNIPDCG